jgi:hypothetical protein
VLGSVLRFTDHPEGFVTIAEPLCAGLLALEVLVDLEKALDLPEQAGGDCPEVLDVRPWDRASAPR